MQVRKGPDSVPLTQYHPGQIKVQEEANSRIVADHLANWTGPAAEFALEADLFVLSSVRPSGSLAVHFLSGEPPLIDITGDDRIAFRPVKGRDELGDGRVGGLAINLAAARRVRINGTVSRSRDAVEMDLTESFTLCRKYVQPSIGAEIGLPAGPAERRSASPADPDVLALLARSETAFLATVSPDGWPDVAHRGGPPGFITLDVAAQRLTWPEFVGDGVFKSAGNARTTGHVTLVALDVETGAGVELVGRGDYINERVLRKERREPLVQFKASYPMQGRMECTLETVTWINRLAPARRRIPKALKVTSSSTPDDQAPQ
jgi:hypothetical protein